MEEKISVETKNILDELRSLKELILAKLGDKVDG